MYLITHNRFGQALGQDFLAQSAPISDEERFQQSLDAIQRELRLRLRADDASGIYARRGRLREAFQAVPASRAEELYDRLQSRNNPLGRLFHDRLASATRNEMRGILCQCVGTLQVTCPQYLRANEDGEVVGTCTEEAQLRGQTPDTPGFQSGDTLWYKTNIPSNRCSGKFRVHHDAKNSSGRIFHTLTPHIPDPNWHRI
jgi:hypothetical protein